MNSEKFEVLPGSFRDPSGFVFSRQGIICRQINDSYQTHYNQLIDSGLYRRLTDEGLLIPHDECEIPPIDPTISYKVIRPQQLSFISYAYEWSFSQIKAAALATLKIQKLALQHGMSLKDASAFNIQWHEGRPVFIDTLSFETHRKDRPWVAYKQFCQHFLATLALMSHRDIRLGQLLRVHIDGIPLDLASSLLPFHTHFNISLLTHIHLHAKAQKHFSDKTVKTNKREMSQLSYLGIVDHLERAIQKLKWRPSGTEWGDYYEATNYSDESLRQKKECVAEFIELVHPKSVWDLGANTGVFSRIASCQGIPTIAFDIDPAAVEKHYLASLKNRETHIHPLVLDCLNPSGGIGWAHKERMSLMERGPVDMVFALALIHHLAISNNLPIDRIADFLRKIGRSLIIEFVPKNDSQVERLLRSRDDIFPKYTQDYFEKAFRKHFDVIRRVHLKDGKRTLYLMQRKENKLEIIDSGP